MTAIAAIVEDGVVYIGGDSAGVSGLSLEVRKDAKVFIVGEFVMGFTTSFRMGSLLRYSFDPPEHPARMGIERYMNTIFVDAVRKCFAGGGYLKKNSEAETGGAFIIGYRGKLFYMEDDFQIGIPATNYTAVGCGHDLCKGALHATTGLNIAPEKRIKMALRAAETFSGGVRGPFVIKRL